MWQKGKEKMNKLFSKIAALSVGLAMAVGVGVAVGSKSAKVVKAESASVSISERATTLSWSNGVAYSGWTDSSGLFTFTQTGGGNNGKYYTSDTSWRFYTGGTVGISCSSDYEISSVSSTPSKTFTIATDKHSASCALTATTKFTAFTITYENAGGETYYSVTYDPNGATSGTAPVDSNSYTAGSEFTVLGNTGNLAKTGYTFGGWNTKADGTGYARTIGSKYTINGNTTIYAKWDADTLESLVISGEMTKSNYKVGDSWDTAGLTVTANYESGASADVTSEVEWSFNPATATSTSVTSVTATASFGGESDSYTKTVSVTEGVTYDLTKISGFSSWTTSYMDHTVTSENVGSTVAATMNFKITNKQSKDVGSTYPCIGGKTESEVECLKFTLSQEGKKITSVEIVFVTRYTNTYPSFYLHKGSGISSEAIAELTMSGAQASEHSLTYDNLNDTVFTVGYNAHQTGSNGATGIKAIIIGLADQSSFGTLDHIKVTALPTVSVYHVGETYDNSGLAITAYDGANESTANFKDVTSESTYSFANGTVFTDSHVPSVSVSVTYSTAPSVAFTLSVYALAEYELVTEELSDWSGQYLIVGTNYNSDLVAMNGGLSNPDTPDGYKVVSASDNVIETGQELEWTIAPMTGGYSIQGKSGKYIGSLTAKSNGMLVSETALLNTIVFSAGEASITGTNEYSLKINNETATSRFRYYASGSVQLYKLKTSDKADQFAQTFLGAFTCDATGESEPTFNVKEGSTKWSWALLATEYDTLNAAEKEQFRLGVASKDGDNIAQALARYDFVVGKYGTAKYADFMLRDPAPIGVGRLDSELNIADHNTTMIIVIAIAATSAIALSLLLVLKKRKHN